MRAVCQRKVVKLVRFYNQIFCAFDRQRREIVAVAVLFQRHFGRRTHGAVERCAGDIAAVPRKADDRLARLVVIRLRRIRLRVIRKLPDRLNRLVKAVFIKITDKIHVMRTGIDPQRSAVICCKRIEIRALVITGQVKFLQKVPMQ